ncbi:MAG TPA: hypothetical protein PK719_01705 [Bacteroidales bacterium]|nr:hypothetical protein [Bacteroidales bacterium]HQG62345.1 hypothetical protein [Bacteroidales bacterium]
MKKGLLSIVFLSIMTVALLTDCSVSRIEKAPGTINKSITGTWQMKMFKYGTSKTFSSLPQDMEYIKMITDTHFLWVHYSKLTKKINSSAGGSYTLNNDTYTESIDFGLGMDSYLGSKPAYNIKIEGDLLFLTGNLVEGYKIEEIWERVH